jgi:hypothetical protein
MDATATSFHTPYSCWPPSGVIINENHFNFHVNGRQTSYSVFSNCCTHVSKIIYNDF